MKALKILGIVFGILLLLTGGALLVGSAVAGKGQTAIDNELAKSGYAGPVQGTVTAVDSTTKFVTVAYTDKQGQEQAGEGPSTNQADPPAVGEKVSVYYLASSRTRSSSWTSRVGAASWESAVRSEPAASRP